MKIDNHRLLTALIYRLENGCSWRSLPETFGHWHVIYVRLNRWAQNGVLERVYAALSVEGIATASVYSLDSTSIKVHPGCPWGEKKNGKQAIGRYRGGWNTKIHAVTAGDTHIVVLLLSAGNVSDVPAGRPLLEVLGKQEETE